MNRSMDLLIVDDDLNMTHTLCDILEVSGFACDTASDAREGLKRMKQNLYHVVLTDIRMPGMNGVDFQQVIKNTYPGTQVILMTAYADQELIARGRTGGVLAFMDKPLDLPLLLSILHALKTDGSRKSGSDTGTMPGDSKRG
jgi:two-component system nitrogen regulation response regulator GlnG